MTAQLYRLRSPIKAGDIVQIGHYGYERTVIHISGRDAWVTSPEVRAGVIVPLENLTKVGEAPK